MLPPVEISGVPVGGDRLVLISGPCVIESRELCLSIAASVRKVCDHLGVGYIFKASYDKANRTSGSSFRGMGMEEGLKVLEEVRREIGVPVLTDIHECWQAGPVAEVADVIQIPAFLCRQTDLLMAAGQTGKAVNVKKGQFLAPKAMESAVAKVRSTGNTRILLTERGSSFGYGDLVVDVRSIPIMRSFGCPVVIDGTHSVQKPAALGDRSGGDRAMVQYITRAALACGADAIFLEVHPDPDRALSDGPNSLPLDALPRLLPEFAELFAQARRMSR